jgi:hypothetical protein
VAGVYLPPKVHQTFSILPLRDNFQLDFQQKWEEIKDNSKSTVRVAKARALEDFVNKSDRGMTLRDLVTLAGFITEMEGLRCDHCPDEESCRFLHPAIAYTLPEDVDFCCGGCHARQAKNAATSQPCTIRNMSPKFVKQLLALPAFKAHVPCHGCWESGQLCDNNAGSCNHCLDSGISCHREACVGFYESRGAPFCRIGCDQAHLEDEYTNVVAVSRADGGYNAQLAAWKKVVSKDSRVALCTECWLHFRDGACTNDEICAPCEVRMQKGEHISCKRLKCKKFASCLKKDCTLAHAAQAFEDEDLEEFGKGRPNRYRN